MRSHRIRRQFILWVLSGAALLIGSLAPAWGQEGKKDGPQKGDWVGLWEVIDPQFPKAVVKIVEFTKEGNYQETGANGANAKNYQFSARGGLLSLTYTHSTGKVDLMEQGTVQWDNAVLFKYTLMRGAGGGNQKAKVYEFHRQSSPDGPNDIENIVGVWKCTDSKTNRTRIIELFKDGTFQEGNAGPARNAGPGGWHFRYKDRILSLIWIQPSGREDRAERGRTEWVNKDLFKFKMLDGYKMGNSRGVVSEFQRVDRKP